jgi:lipocalin
MGTWYEIQRFDSWFERKLKCGKAHYDLVSATSINVTNSGVNKKTGILNELHGSASIKSLDKPNVLSLSLPIVVKGIIFFFLKFLKFFSN